MENSALKQLLTEYEKKRMHAVYEAKKRKEEIYSRIPRLQDIDDSLTKEAINTSKLMLNNNNPELVKKLEEKINNYKKEKESLLSSIGKTVYDLKPKFDCETCKDTGYVTDGYHSSMCNCLKQRLFNLEYNKSNISNLENQKFENFLSTYYSDIVDKNKYNSDKSPRENIENIKKIAYKFIENFDNPNENNLLFTGNTGLGKTFLSSCIANELLKRGKTVLYQTAPVMLDTIIDYRFGKKDVPSNIYDNLLHVDLLIIDDLGTESMNSMKFTELFNVLNTRLLNPNNKVTKTIISTNLSLQNLYSNYDERIVSRIIGNYNICYFYGEDIRFQKRFNNK